MKTARHAASACLGRSPSVFTLAACLLLSAGCIKVHQANMTQLDAVGMHPESLDQLQKYHVNDEEVRQILIVGRAGLTEQASVELVGIARSRQRVFGEGDAIANLLGAGMNENSVMQLVRLDQLTLFAGEAAAMRLAGLSDDVILEVARQRSKGETVLAGSRLAELRDSGLSNTQLVAAVDRGITDKQADDIIARHNYAVGGHRFVRQQGRRH
jgi:hypothetical protein